MNKLFTNTILILSISLSLTGCGNKTDVTEVHTTLNTDITSSDTISDSNNSSPDNSIISVNDSNNNYIGNYDAIFANEIITSTDNAPVHIAIKGYDFAIDSSAYCTYFEGVGPAVVIGNKLQYKLVVQDRTWDEITNMDVTAKAVAAGATIKNGPKTITDNGFEYIVFEYEMSGERSVAINLPGPDKNHAIGVQIAILDDAISEEDAVAVALPVARSASITSLPDTTKEEIDKLYDGIGNIGGIHLSEATINFDGTTYIYNVPSGYNQTSDEPDEDIYMQTYRSKDSEISVLFTRVMNFTDSKYYLENMLMFNVGEQISDIKVDNNGIAYAQLYHDDFDTYGIAAAKFIDNKYIFYLESEGKNKMNLEDVIDFFSEKAPQVAENSNPALGPRTAIKHDQRYLGQASNNDDALSLITQYGNMQREHYNNPEVTKIEMDLQSKYNIAAVNLGELDIDTAKDVEKGVSYMFDTYPILKGSLNTISLANLPANETSYVALTQSVDFIVQDNDGIEWPKTIRHEIILNANKWLDRDGMLKMCKEHVDSGYWFDNAKDPSKIVVHELGHQLLNVVRAKEYSFVENGIYMPCQLTDNNRDAYLDYYWSGTAMNQEVETKLIQNAYKEWKNKGNKGPEEEFRKSISQYANGIQKDGGVSYHETFAEAIADIYCNGDNASDASKAIVNQILKKING